MRPFDFILAPFLVLLAWQVLKVKDLFVGIILFIFYGLMCALAWVELEAPDVAMVEAAIGAGIIGALLLGSLGYMESCEEREHKYAPKRLFFLLPAALALALIISLVLIGFPEEGSGLGSLVRTHLAQAGVDNPVTAVILNFRSFDNLLQIGMLLVVTIGALALGKVTKEGLLEESAMLNFFLHLLIPMLALVGALLLWAGVDAPGGSFQAGALFAALGILLFLGRGRFALDFSRLSLRLLVAGGFISFILIGLFGGLWSYRGQEAKVSVLLSEAFITASIATALLTLFAVCSGFLKREQAK